MRERVSSRWCGSTGKQVAPSSIDPAGQSPAQEIDPRAVWLASPDSSEATRERKPRAEEPNLTVRLPQYVQQAVRMRAVSERTTVRLVILRALRGAGFEVDDSDMTDDRGIVAKMRTRERAGQGRGAGQSLEPGEGFRRGLKSDS